MNEDRPPRVSSAPRCEPSWTKFDASATHCAGGVPLVPYFEPCSSERIPQARAGTWQSVAVRRAGLGAVRRAQGISTHRCASNVHPERWPRR